MDTVFVVPGIMGSELYLGTDKLWPPKAIGKVKDPDRLLESDVIVGDIIRNVLVFGFYSKLIQPLERWGFSEMSGGSRGIVLAWPYNWVRSVPENAARLAQDVQAAIANHPDNKIVLLAHSMGGLIATYALECLAQKDTSWRRSVRLLVTFGAPFHGAPEALKNAFGAEGVKGIAADDCQRLMADPRFPSAYQLFPHLTAHAIWDSQPPLLPLPDYKYLDAQGTTLGRENLRDAIAFHDALRAAVENPETRKFNFCGSVYSTVWSAWRTGSAGAIAPYEAKAGDGTVPSWSGRQNATVQFAALGAKHSTTFEDGKLLDILHDLLVAPAGPTTPPSGSANAISRMPNPSPEAQPKVSVVSNAVSSLRSSVEIEVAEPPVGNTLHLGWVRVEDVETIQDLLKSLSRAEFNALEASVSIPLGEQLDFPLQFSIPRPAAIGQYALVAWSGERIRELAGLDLERMDVVWVFDDFGYEGATTNGSSVIVDLGDYGRQMT